MSSLLGVHIGLSHRTGKPFSILANASIGRIGWKVYSSIRETLCFSLPSHDEGRIVYMQEAFNQVCNEAKQASGFYVCLMMESPYYGGPEEGGWWGTDSHIVAYQWYETAEQAESAKEAVTALAKELQDKARQEYGQKCLDEMDWLEDRMLESDFLPEPDGPEEYYVLMSEGLPEPTRGPRGYE